MTTDNRRDSIIKAAYDVVMENGLPFISQELIAKRSGLSRQLVRYHFNDKEDLMVALCDLLAASYRQALVDVALTAGASDRLGLMLDFYFDFVDGNLKPRDDQVYDAVLSLAAGSDRVRENLREQYSLLGNVVSHEISVTYPDLSAEDAKQLSYLFVCLMYGHWKMVATLGMSEDHRHVTRAAIDRLIGSYRQQPSGSDAQPKNWAVDGQNGFFNSKNSGGK